MHGYGISQKLAALSHNNFQVQPRTRWFPYAVPAGAGRKAVGRMAAECENNRNAKYYTLTPAGRRQLERHRGGSAGTGSRSPLRAFWRAHDVPASGSGLSSWWAPEFGTGPKQGLADELQAFDATCHAAAKCVAGLPAAEARRPCGRRARRRFEQAKERVPAHIGPTARCLDELGPGTCGMRSEHIREETPASRSSSC
jgi:DNA-binding PadR family transcriptional regulator